MKEKIKRELSNMQAAEEDDDELDLDGELLDEKDQIE
jgi:hypothetical protein